MRVFDFISKRDHNDATQKAILKAGILPGEMWLISQDRFLGYWNTTMTRFCPAIPLSSVSPEWCKNTAAEFKEKSQYDVVRLEIHPDDKHVVVFNPHEDCFRIFEKEGASFAPTLQICKGNVISNRAELEDMGLHPWVADLDDEHEAFNAPSYNEDGSPFGAPFLNGWEKLISQRAIDKAGALSESVKRLRKSKAIFPAQEDLFRSLVLTAPDNVKVVILGPDPYATPNVADGLAFSIKPGNEFPAPLHYIYKVVEQDIGAAPPFNGDLTAWAKQGVLLLNTVLSVEATEPLSHALLGWQEVTQEIIRACGLLPQPIVFLLWGKSAVQFCNGIIPRNESKKVLTAGYPGQKVPLASHLSFPDFETAAPFSSANEFLNSHGVSPIDWACQEKPFEAF